MPIKRVTMKFLVPVSVFGIKSETLSGRRSIPCYINPQELSVDESKLITETFTKGGYLVEYWGEELPTITARGTTGSGGVEAIEVLRAVYRNEQLQMERLLIERARETSDAAGTSSPSATAQTGLASALDSLLGNGFSEIIDGTTSVIENITSIFDDSPEEDPNPVTLIPSLGTFAVAVDLYLQGFKYRGFFKTFRASESGESPGHFDYEFTFKVLRRTGRRRNFMPWHRNPYDANGNPTEASIPIEGARPDELSYGTNIEGNNSIVTTNGFSTFTGSENDIIQDPNDVGVSRLNKVKS